MTLKYEDGNNVTRLFALLIVILLTINSNLISCYPLIDFDFRKIGPSESTDKNFEDFEVSRMYRLYNRCSNRLVQIRWKKKSVNARATKPNKFTNLVLTSDKGRVSIRGNKTNKYLCFKKKGLLVLRRNAKKTLPCLFRELYAKDPAYTLLQSDYNPNWYVGFDRYGSPLAGHPNITNRINRRRSRRRRARRKKVNTRHYKHRRKVLDNRKRPHPDNCYMFVRKDFTFLPRSPFKSKNLGTAIDESESGRVVV